MENLRRRKNLIIVTNTEQAEYYCNKFKFNRFNIFKENFVGVTMIKKKIKWNKPTYLGAAILDVSKLQLYKFHYENLVPKYGRRARVLYKYTDSLFCQVQTPDLYRDLVGFKNKLDLSDYPPNHFLFSIDNKKVQSIGNF